MTRHTFRRWYDHRRIERLVITLAVFVVAAAVLAAGGTQEPQTSENGTTHSQNGTGIADAALSGEVVVVEELPGGSVLLTIRQPNNAEVFVEIPAPLAKRTEISVGDVIRTRERRMARDGERLQVRTLEVRRSR